jgi:predicted nucleotidyltransferase
MPSSDLPCFADRLIDTRLIERLAGDIVRLFSPEKIILFGSYAYGRPTEDSDVDLMMVMPHRGPGYRTATRIRLAVEVTFPMDLLVRSAAELRRGVSQHDWFIVEVLEKGIILHDRTDPSMGAKGRSRLRRRFAPPAIAQAHSVRHDPVPLPTMRRKVLEGAAPGSRPAIPQDARSSRVARNAADD